MPNKIYEEDKFVAKCLELKDRFRLIPENKEYKTLFPNSQDKNVPLDGLHVYFEQTWSVIREDKELNLPDQREMVANYRCNEIKEEALLLVQDELYSL